MVTEAAKMGDSSGRKNQVGKGVSGRGREKRGLIGTKKKPSGKTKGFLVKIKLLDHKGAKGEQHHQGDGEKNRKFCEDWQEGGGPLKPDSWERGRKGQKLGRKISPTKNQKDPPVKNYKKPGWEGREKQHRTPTQQIPEATKVHKKKPKPVLLGGKKGGKGFTGKMVQTPKRSHRGGQTLTWG